MPISPITSGKVSQTKVTHGGENVTEQYLQKLLESKELHSVGIMCKEPQKSASSVCENSMTGTKQ